MKVGTPLCHASIFQKPILGIFCLQLLKITQMLTIKSTWRNAHMALKKTTLLPIHKT